MSERKAQATRIATALALPALLCALCMVIVLRGTAGTFAVEYILYASAMWGLWALTGRAYAAWLAGAAPLLLTLVDYFRRMINGEPLALSEFALARQFGEIVRFAAPQLRFPARIIAALSLYVLVLAALVVWRRKLTPPQSRARALTALCGASAIVLLFFSQLGTTLTDAAMRAPAADGTVVARLLHAYRGRYETVNIPEQLDWTPEEPKDPGAAPEEVEEVSEPDRPTVIFLMSESFFDCTELPNVTFDEDLLRNFHALQKTSRHGKFISMTYCGGTGYVEMEVLTGMCGALLRSGDNLCNLPDEAYRTMPCIADVFDAYGYHKTFIHAYNDALFNRRTIYNAFGFDEVCFEEDFSADAERRGGFISDMALSRELIARYEAGEGPRMFFAVSMENHQPYTAGEFDGNDVTFQSDRLDETAAEVLRTYAYGARDADAALGYLTDYFSGVDEKVMIVFWGDHLPNLGIPGGTVYESLGRVPTSDTAKWTTEELVTMSSTDYLIWTNYGTDTTEAVEGNTLFGVHVLERLGFRLSGYYQWVRENVEPFYTVLRERLFMDAALEAWFEIPEQYRDRMVQWRDVEYALAYSGNPLFPHARE